MKQLILNTLLILSSAYGFSQAPNIEGTWYLHTYEMDEGVIVEIKDIVPRIAPTINFDAEHNFTGIVCNEYGGEFIYNEAEDNFTLTFFGICLCGSCNNPPQSHITVEADYFGYFVEGQVYEYNLSEILGNWVLQISSAPAFELTYYRTPASLFIDEKTPLRITVHPNPASNAVYVSSEAIIDQIDLYNLSGTLLETTVASIHEIDVASLIPGVYFLKITSGNKSAIHKFIKE
ncbi:MAG: T9SS type A sorting domain-containing protein [Marinirhabdus sp.]|nr:T9SS type A sorting domain-containing protein [Marinirhabdus sp.]